METLELPVTEEREEIATAPVNFVEQEIDIAAFGLWRQASLLAADEDETTEQRAQNASA